MELDTGNNPELQQLKEIIEEQNGLIAALNFRLHSLINKYDRNKSTETCTN